MKRHVINRFRRRLSFEQRDRDIVVSDRHAAVEFEFFPQSQSALEPFRALLRIADSQSKMADFSKCKWNLHLTRQLRVLPVLGTISRNQWFHEAQVEFLQGVTRCLAQVTCASLQLRPDIGKPDGAKHP